MMAGFSKSNTPEGSRDLWETPPAVFEAIQVALNIRFAHDVCALESTSKCGGHYWGPDRGDDALIIDWKQELSFQNACNPRPMIAAWMNPPYSDPTPWVRKAQEEASKGLIVVGLLIDDRSTRWYQQHVEGVAFLALVPDRRISFLQDGKPVNGNLRPSVFPVWAPWITGRTEYVRFSLPEKKRRAA